MLYSYRTKLLASLLTALTAVGVVNVTTMPSQAWEKPSTTSLTMARKLYKAHRFAEASSYFEKAARAEGSPAIGFLYEAHCQYYLGHKEAAVQNYKLVQSHYPASAEGKEAARYLAAIDPHGQILKASIGGHGGSSSPYSQTQSSSIMSSAFSNRIEVVRPIVGHLEVAQLTVDTIKGELSKLPPGVQNLLISRGIKICLTTTLIDKFPALAFREGRGYDGYTYKSCPGMFSNDIVYICERTVNEVSNEVEAPIPLGKVSETFYHEIGHAIDGCLGCCSASAEYRHAYYLDLARMPADAAGRLSYYIQKSLPGQQESCGEITAVCLNDSQSDASDIKQYFPMTVALIQKKLSGNSLVNPQIGSTQSHQY